MFRAVRMQSVQTFLKDNYGSAVRFTDVKETVQGIKKNLNDTFKLRLLSHKFQKAAKIVAIGC